MSSSKFAQEERWTDETCKVIQLPRSPLSPSSRSRQIRDSVVPLLRQFPHLEVGGFMERHSKARSWNREVSARELAASLTIPPTALPALQIWGLGVIGTLSAPYKAMGRTMPLCLNSQPSSDLSLKRSCDLAGPAAPFKREARSQDDQQALGGLGTSGVQMSQCNATTATKRWGGVCEPCWTTLSQAQGCTGGHRASSRS